MKNFNSVETWWHDTRFAFRALRKYPIVASVIVLSLAFGIGANSAIFSVLNAVVLRPLPVPEPQRLFLITWSAKGSPANLVESVEGPIRRNNGTSWSYSFSSDVVHYIHDHNHTFDNVIAFSANNTKANIGLKDHATSAVIQAVSGDFFEGLRIAPFQGRAFSIADDVESAQAVAMV